MVEGLQRHFCAHGRAVQCFSDLQPSFLSAYKRLKDKGEQKMDDGTDHLENLQVMAKRFDDWAHGANVRNVRGVSHSPWRNGLLERKWPLLDKMSRIYAKPRLLDPMSYQTHLDLVAERHNKQPRHAAHRAGIYV